MKWSALLWMLLLLVANGFFVAAEFAYLMARRNVLERRRTLPSRVADRLIRDLSLSLTAAQLGITIASLLLGFVAEPAVASALEGLFGFVPFPEPVLHTISLVIALVIVVFLHMVVGEMAPKNIVIAAPERTALILAIPFRAFIVVFRPGIGLLNGIANAVLRVFGVRPKRSLDFSHSAGDLAAVVSAGQREGVIEDGTHRLLIGAIGFGEREAVDVMVPRPDVVAMSADATVEDIERVIQSTGHSRILIHSGDLDDVLGFVHIKDLLEVEGEANRSPLEPSLIRSLLVVPDRAPLQPILADMRRTRNHVALVVDEHGGTAGIITLEDIVEVLVGAIRDEYDPPASLLAIVDGHPVVIAGSVRCFELEVLGVGFPETESETVGGLVTERLGRFARLGDVVESGGWRFRVVRMKGRRVSEVEVTLVRGQGESEDGV